MANRPCPEEGGTSPQCPHILRRFRPAGGIARDSRQRRSVQHRIAQGAEDVEQRLAASFRSTAPGDRIHCVGNGTGDIGAFRLRGELLAELDQQCSV